VPCGCLTIGSRPPKSGQYPTDRSRCDGHIFSPVCHGLLGRGSEAGGARPGLLSPCTRRVTVPLISDSGCSPSTKTAIVNRGGAWKPASWTPTNEMRFLDMSDTTTSFMLSNLEGCSSHARSHLTKGWKTSGRSRVLPSGWDNEALGPTDGVPTCPSDSLSQFEYLGMYTYSAICEGLVQPF
jgi:hypothetical protein